MNEEILLFDLRGNMLVHRYGYEPISFYSFLEEIFVRGDDPELPFDNRESEQYLWWSETAKDKKGKEVKYYEGYTFQFNALARSIPTVEGEKSKSYVITRDFDAGFMLSDPFVIMSPITYVGRNRSTKNARCIYALVFDLDGVGEQQLIDFFHQEKNNLLHRPNKPMSHVHFSVFVSFNKYKLYFTSSLSSLDSVGA